jgi:hypothetical protein
MSLIGQVHSMVREEGSATALVRRRARRMRCSVGVGEGRRGRPVGLGGLKRLNLLAGCWTGWAES